MALVPLVDFLNHADEPSCALRGAGAGAGGQGGGGVVAGDFQVCAQCSMYDVQCMMFNGAPTPAPTPALTPTLCLPFFGQR